MLVSDPASATAPDAAVAAAPDDAPHRVVGFRRTGDGSATVHYADGRSATVSYSRRPGRLGTDFEIHLHGPEPRPDGLPERGPDHRVRQRAEIVFDRGVRLNEATATQALTQLHAALTAAEHHRPVLERAMRDMNTPAEIAAVRGAIDAASRDIRAGLLANDPGARIEGHHDGDGKATVEISSSGRRIAVEVLVDELHPGETHRVEALPEPDGSPPSRARVYVAESVAADSSRLTTVVSERVVGAAELLRHGDRLDEVGRLDPDGTPPRRGRLAAADRAQLAALEQAVRVGDHDGVVAILAESGLLGDQPLAGERAHAIRDRLKEMDPEIARRMFDTRSRVDRSAVEASLAHALFVAADAFTSDHVRGAAIRDGEIRVQVGDERFTIKLDVDEHPTDRRFAVRLEADPDRPGEFRLRVRGDASDEAVLVDTARALAEFGHRKHHGWAFAHEAGDTARAKVLKAMYREVDGPAHRRIIEAYADGMPARDPADRQRVLDDLRRRPRRPHRLDLSRPLLDDPSRRRPYAPHYFRRVVASAGSGGNTFWVGGEFGRSQASIYTSAGAGFFANLGQATADGTLGKPLPTRRLTTAALGPPREPTAPPERSRGDRFGANVRKRTLYAISGSAATTIIYAVSGGDLAKAGKGGGIMFVASLTQAGADKLADPHEFTAAGKRSAIERHEPDALRNQYAESMAHLTNRLRAEVAVPSEPTRRALQEAHGRIERMIKQAEPEVEHKLDALRRRRSVVVAPATTVWNGTVGRVPLVVRWHSPTVTYDMVHLPEARGPKVANAARVGFQQALMQLPSLYLGVSKTPELLWANFLAGGGRGTGYGLGWTELTVRQADDATAAQAARALHHLRTTRDNIEAILDPGQSPRPRPETPSRPFGWIAQAWRDHQAGIPREESLRSQTRKHIAGFVGGVAAASPLLALDIPGGSEKIWIAGQAVYTALYALGEGAMRVVPVLLNRIDSTAQLAAQADRLPFTPEEIASDVNGLARAGEEASARILPMRVPEQPPLGERLIDGVDGFRHGTIRAALGAGRLLDIDALVGRAPALRPGDNSPYGVRLGVADARDVNRLVELTRDLHRVVDRPVEVAEHTTAAGDRVANADGGLTRTPVAQQPAHLRAHLTVELERLGLLVEQAGSDDRWSAVVKDAGRRFGLDLTQTELGALRANRELAVQDLVTRLHDSRPVDHAINQALDAMARQGWSTRMPSSFGGDGVRHVHVSAPGLLSVLTERGRFRLAVTAGDVPAGVLAALRPAAKGAHRLVVGPAAIADPGKLATVLDAAVTSWTDHGFTGSDLLIIKDRS